MGMRYGLTAYKELQVEIELLRIRLDEVENEYVATYRGCFTPGRAPWMPVDKAIERLEEIERKFVGLYEVLKGKQEALKRMDSMISGLDGTEQRIAVLRDVEGMQLDEIAIKLGCSLSSVKKISAKLPRIAAG